MKVALVANIAAPYRLPTWEALAKRVERLDVILCAQSEGDRIWDLREIGRWSFGVQVLPGWSGFVAGRDWPIHWNPGILKALRRLNSTHIIVVGYQTPTYIAAILYARLHKIPLTFWWGSHALSSRSRGGVIAFVRRRILKLADSFVTYGTWATEYLRRVGIPDDRIATGFNTVDVKRFGELVDGFRANEGEGSRRQVRFLYVGQFIERKGVRELLQAFRALPREKTRLTLVGYGSQEDELKQFVSDNALSNVAFAGATKTIEETARHYAGSDVLVLASHLEVWGLVVNEALASGLYVLVSSRAGASFDMIQRAPAPVGEVFDPRDEISFQGALRSAFDRVVAGQLDRSEIAAWGRSHTPERYADAIVAALEKSCR